MAPIIGGDDILIFTHPASFDMIKNILFQVEDGLQRKLNLPDPLKMNFSFLLCKYNFPIYHIFKLSEDLLKTTKDAYYKNGDKQTRYGFFKVLEGRQKPSKEDTYLKDEFETLLSIAQAISTDEEIHTSALHNLLESISDPNSMPESNPDRCLTPEREMNVLYFLARHGEFRNHLSGQGPDFYLTHKGGNRIKLTQSSLEDLIVIIQDLLGRPLKEDKEER